jgi:hypothetical protein
MEGRHDAEGKGNKRIAMASQLGVISHSLPDNITNLRIYTDDRSIILTCDDEPCRSATAMSLLTKGA